MSVVGLSTHILHPTNTSAHAVCTSKTKSTHCYDSRLGSVESRPFASCSWFILRREVIRSSISADSSEDRTK